MTDHTLSDILDALRIIVHALQSGSRSSLEQVGLTGAQLFVLEKLRESDSMSVNELAEATHTRQSTVSVVVSKLVKKGMVSRVRSGEDARVQQLSITKRGAAKLEGAPETVQDRLVKALKTMRNADRDTLASLLERLLTEAGLTEIKPEFFLEQSKRSDRGRN